MAEAIARVRALHRDLLEEYPGRLTVHQVMQRQAEVLLAAHHAGDAASCFQLSSWLPRLVGRSEAETLAESLTAADALLCVAREHGFAHWEAVPHQALDAAFESAATAVVTGDLDTLRSCLEARSELARQRSAYGHRATLLHYTAANGVETWRQSVPSNAAEIVSALLAAGSDVGATMPVYGGEYDTLALLLTSAHPAAAGVDDAVVAILRSRL